MGKIIDNEVYKVEYDRWGKVVIKGQLIIASIVCAIEILNNVLLYVTRSQGYGPDTIVEKLIRYLFITTIINFGLVVISKYIELKIENERQKRFLLMLFTVLICADVAYSHYQFSVTLAIFTIPIILSILYEDWYLSVFTLVISLLGDLVAIIARANDPLYNKDIGPEAAISISLPIAMLIFAKIISNTLEKRRNELKKAIINVEKANAAAEKMTMSMSMLETLASALDAKDRYTNGHSLRVSEYSTRLAQALGWDEESIEILRYEAILHDIGKIGVPDAILNKPARLTDVEFSLIKSHTVVGSDILKNMVALSGATVVARYHHERYDGKGYPEGLSGADIPFNARIVGIADAYDAMSSDRIYRKALGREKIREELVRGRGSQFDPEMLDVFLELFDNNNLVIKEGNLLKQDSGDEQGVLDDIKNMLYRFSDASQHKDSMDDFNKFYIYMRNIGLRYNRAVDVLEINVRPLSDGENTIDELEMADVLQAIIRKNIRAVDMCHRYSSYKHMVILLDAGIDNIDIIKQRIQFDFDESVLSSDFKLVFEYKDANSVLQNVSS